MAWDGENRWPQKKLKRKLTCVFKLRNILLLKNV